MKRCACCTRPATRHWVVLCEFHGNRLRDFCDFGVVYTDPCCSVSINKIGRAYSPHHRAMIDDYWRLTGENNR